MILNALNGKALPVYGDGMHVRDWLYVVDHCKAIWSIMCHGRRGETYNVGGRNELPNLSVVKLIADILDRKVAPLDSGSRRDLISFVKDRPGHDRRYAIDCSKIEHELKWRPQETFESGFEKTIDWYLNNSDWVSAVQSGDYLRWIEKHYG
jgi:dTDP-glucose 4,6-dehydratase